MVEERTVEEESEGQRLDRWLVRAFPDRSRAALQRWIRDGRVRLDGDPVEKPSHPLKGCESVRVDIPPPRSTELLPEDIPLSILHEDDWIVVLDKPAGLIVHPGAGNRSGTLANALVHRFRALSEAGGPDRPGIVHRLDRDTSGVLVVARTEQAHHRLAEQFAQRTVEKEYVAVVHGVVELDSDWIELPLGRDPKHRERMTVLPVAERGREAATFYRVERRFDRHTYLRLHPRTGRTHQLRVHLRALGYPIVADPIYGRRGGGPDPAPRLMLHAASLTVDHPETGRRLRFEAPLPADLRDLIERLDAGAV